ncbi:hypothetical protein AB0L05_27790 [Nonomuraea pusilla]|uniref:hypothetical protein n=1 Tax=Nonomuraea pusilla TaxID=46177 RepID=UPI00332616D6
MIRRLLRRLFPELIRCEKCGMVIGYNVRAPGEKTLKEYRVEHERICLLADPGTPMPEPRPGDAPIGPTPEEQAKFLQLIDAKQSALIQEVTLYLNRTPENEEETLALLETITPQILHPIMGMGPAATNHAYLNIVEHLVARLAAERGEPAVRTWQREAAELAREDEHRGE